MYIDELNSLEEKLEKFLYKDILCISDLTIKNSPNENIIFEYGKSYQLHMYDFTLLRHNLKHNKKHNYEYGSIYVTNNQKITIIDYSIFKEHFELITLPELRKRKIKSLLLKSK